MEKKNSIKLSRDAKFYRLLYSVSAARKVYEATQSKTGSALTGNRIVRCSVVEVRALSLDSSLHHNKDITTAPR